MIVLGILGLGFFGMICHIVGYRKGYQEGNDNSIKQSKDRIVKIIEQEIEKDLSVFLSKKNKFLRESFNESENLHK